MKIVIATDGEGQLDLKDIENILQNACSCDCNCECEHEDNCEDCGEEEDDKTTISNAEGNANRMQTADAIKAFINQEEKRQKEKDNNIKDINKQPNNPDEAARVADKAVLEYLHIMYPDKVLKGLMKLYYAVKDFVFDETGLIGVDLCREASRRTIDILDYIEATKDLEED